MQLARSGGWEAVWSYREQGTSLQLLELQRYVNTGKFELTGDLNKEDVLGRSLIPPLIWVLNIGGNCGHLLSVINAANQQVQHIIRDCKAAIAGQDLAQYHFTLSALPKTVCRRPVARDELNPITTSCSPANDGSQAIVTSSSRQFLLHRDTHRTALLPFKLAATGTEPVTRQPWRQAICCCTAGCGGRRMALHHQSMQHGSVLSGRPAYGSRGPSHVCHAQLRLCPTRSSAACRHRQMPLLALQRTTFHVCMCSTRDRHCACCVLTRRLIRAAGRSGWRHRRAECGSKAGLNRTDQQLPSAERV